MQLIVWSNMRITVFSLIIAVLFTTTVHGQQGMYFYFCLIQINSENMLKNSFINFLVVN